MIRTEDLSKKFDDFLAVDNVNLEVGKGEVLALLGPNGAGKTTTIRMLTSILKPTSGRAEVAGFDVVEDAGKVRSAVGVLTEHHGLYSRMMADEYLDFFGQIHGLSKQHRQDQCDLLLEQFGLAEARYRRIGEYSKGMRQKLALARAMLHDPKVLLLDEPTSAMDPESAHLVRDAIKNLRSSERTVVICTHNLAEAEELADRIAIIRYGQIIARGSPAALKNQLLGPPVFEVALGEAVAGKELPSTNGIVLERFDEHHIRFLAEEPVRDNPLVLTQLLKRGFLVIGLREVPRSLEQVYLQAVLANDSEERTNV